MLSDLSRGLEGNGASLSADWEDRRPFLATGQAMLFVFEFGDWRMSCRSGSSAAEVALPLTGPIKMRNRKYEELDTTSMEQKKRLLKDSFPQLLSLFASRGAARCARHGALHL